MYVAVPTDLDNEADAASLEELASNGKPDGSRWWKKTGSGGAAETGMHATSPWMLRFLFEQVWNVPRPHLVMTITGGAQDFQLSVGQKDKIMRGLMDLAKSMRAWLVTGGSDSGIMKFVGQACAEQSNDVPLIGILPWGVVQGRQGLLCEPSDLRVKPPAETFAVDYDMCVQQYKEQVEIFDRKEGTAGTAGAADRPRQEQKLNRPVQEQKLNHDHTHFILVKDGQSDNFQSEIRLRTEFEACITHYKDYTSDIMQMLEAQKLGWQGMQSEQVRTRQAKRQAEAKRQLRMGIKDHDVIPGVCVCVEGGPGTVETVWRAATRGTPVVVIKNSGRAADLLADVTDLFDPDVERKTPRMEMLEKVYLLLDRASGLQWESTGTKTPEHGREVSNERLARALMSQAEYRASGFEFTQQEWDEFGIQDLRISDFVRAGSRCFVPADREEPGNAEAAAGLAPGSSWEADGSLVDRVLMEYGLRDNTKSPAEKRNTLKRCLCAVCTGRCYVYGTSHVRGGGGGGGWRVIINIRTQLH